MWKDLRKLKKTQGRKRAANTKPCRYGARCPNNGCMFYHEGSGYSSSHVSRSKERLKVSDAELTAQGQGQYFSASYEVERASSSNSDSGERGGVAVIKKQDDASKMVKKLQSQLEEKNELIEFLTESNKTGKTCFDVLMRVNENQDKIIRKMEEEAKNKTKTKTKTKKKCARETRDTDTDSDRWSNYKIVKNRYGRDVRSL